MVKEYREKYGEPDVVEVRQVFDDSLQAREWEEKVIRRMDAVKDERWLNRQNAGHTFSQFGAQSEDWIKKRIESRQGYKHSEETKKKIGAKSKGRRPNLGRIFSNEVRLKISQAQKGKKHSEEQKMKRKEFSKGEGNPMYGKKQPTVRCEVCGIVCSKTNYLRFHGIKCKKENNHGGV